MNEQQQEESEGKQRRADKEQAEEITRTRMRRGRGDEKFYEIEMATDEGIEEEVMSQMVPGAFISFRYSGEHAGSGPPLSPVISFYFILFYFAIFISFYCYVMLVQIYFE